MISALVFLMRIQDDHHPSLLEIDFFVQLWVRLKKSWTMSPYLKEDIVVSDRFKKEAAKMEY